MRPVKGQIDDLLHEIRERVEEGRARAGHHADQAHGRRPGRVLQRGRRALPLHALGDRDPGAHQDPARSAQGRVRCADRHQPAARRTRSARGLAGGDSRCRQGRLPALRRLADPDHRPLRAQSERPRGPLCRQDDRLDAEGDGRDRPPPRHSAGLQRGARHHAGDASCVRSTCRWWPWPMPTTST